MAQKTVLAVDDEPLVLDMIERTLSERGIRVRKAGSAGEAVAALAAGRADLILLDICMPGVTGFQALDLLKEKTKAPILLMTGHMTEETRTDAELLGAADLLEKPFSPASLAEAVLKFL